MPYLARMENTLSVYVEALNETWEMPDALALSLNEYEKENPVGAHNADTVHRQWFATLTAEEQAKIQRSKPQE